MKSMRDAIMDDKEKTEVPNGASDKLNEADAGKKRDLSLEDKRERYKRRKTLRNLAFKVLLVVTVIAGLTAFSYSRSIPERYKLKIGDVAPVDISASRAIVDKAATEKRAQAAARAVPQVYSRSESISASSVARVNKFFSICLEIREDLNKEAGKLSKTENTASADGKTEPSQSASPVPVFTADQIERFAFSLVEKLGSELNFSMTN